MWCTLFNDLIASVQRDSSTSANIISGLFSRHSNVILEEAKGHGLQQDAALPTPKPRTQVRKTWYTAKSRGINEAMLVGPQMWFKI